MKENILKKYGMTLIKGESPNITITGGPGISIKTDGILIDRVRDSNVDRKVIGANVTIVETFDNGKVTSRKVYANKHITESDIEKITSRCGFGKLDSFIFNPLPNVMEPTKLLNNFGYIITVSNIDNLVFSSNDKIKTDGHIYEMWGLYVRNASYVITGDIRFFGCDVERIDPRRHINVYIDFDKADNATAKNLMDDFYIMFHELNKQAKEMSNSSL